MRFDIDLVKQYTKMQVYQVEDGMEVQPNCAYIIPPNRDMAFLHGKLHLMEPGAPRGLRLPIDFFLSLAHFLPLQPTLQVVGRATSGVDALDQAKSLHPDLVLMDLVMPGMNGLEATRLFKALGEMPRIVVLTLYDLPQYCAAATRAGADGFLAKSEWSTQLMPEIGRGGHSLWLREHRTDREGAR